MSCNLAITCVHRLDQRKVLKRISILNRWFSNIQTTKHDDDTLTMQTAVMYVNGYFVGISKASHRAKRGYIRQTSEGRPREPSQGGDDWRHEGHSQVKEKKVLCFRVEDYRIRSILCIQTGSLIFVPLTVGNDMWMHTYL